MTPRADALIREALAGRLDERFLTIDEVREAGQRYLLRECVKAIQRGPEAYAAFMEELSEAGLNFGLDFNKHAAFMHRNAAWLSPEGTVHPLPNEGEKNGRKASEYWHQHWAEDPDNQHLIPDHVKAKNPDGSIDGIETKHRMFQNKWIRVGGVNKFLGAAHFEATDHPGVIDKIRDFLHKNHSDALDAIASKGGFTVDMFHPETGASLGQKTYTLTGKRAPEDVSDVARARKVFAHPAGGPYGSDVAGNLPRRRRRS